MVSSIVPGWNADVFPEPTLIVPPIETSFGILLTKISSIARLPDATVFVGASNFTREVVIPIVKESDNPRIDLFKPETKILSLLKFSIKGM